MGDVQGAVWSTPCALLSTEVPGYLYGGADGYPACAQHFLSVGASLWQMGPGSWTKLISSTPPLKGTVERLLRSALYLHGPSRAEPSHDGEKKKNTHTHRHRLGRSCHVRLGVRVKEMPCCCLVLTRRHDNWQEGWFWLRPTYSNVLSKRGELGETIQKEQREKKVEHFSQVKRWKRPLHGLFGRRVTVRFQRPTGIAVTFWSIFRPASMQIQNASSLCLTGSWPRLRSEGAKVDMSTIPQTNYERLSPCQTITPPPCPTEHEENRLLIIRSGRWRHVVDSFQINAQPRKDDTLSVLNVWPCGGGKKLFPCSRNVRQPFLLARSRANVKTSRGIKKEKEKKRSIRGLLWHARSTQNEFGTAQSVTCTRLEITCTSGQL